MSRSCCPPHFLIALSAAAGAGVVAPRAAEACGCFAAPSPVEPVVQAGERIVFAQADGRVIMHIQIQYTGEASDFAWLVPVPSVPELRLGSEELFTQLQAVTSPQFVLQQAGDVCTDAEGGGLGCSDTVAFDSRAGLPAPEVPSDVAVKEASAGPYDYAVVRADALEPMVAWLDANRYFVPDGSDAALAPYIRPGAYFLALKLRAGESTGDLQPVVLEYDAALPSIPIILTRIGAVEDMGIQVWVLGKERAVPRNYRHVEINQEYLDWPGGVSNYQAVVARAVDEAEGGRGFVTEMAGPTEPMRDLLDYAGRFGTRAELERAENLWQLFDLVERGDFPPGPMRAIWERNYPMPAQAAAEITADAYYAELPRSVSIYDPEAGFDAAALTAEIWERIVDPTLEAGQLFRDNGYMTRLLTVMSPDEMTVDPVFEMGSELGDVGTLRQASFFIPCSDGPTRLLLSDGREFEVADLSQWTSRDRAGVPRAARIENLRAEGPPEIVVDNTEALADSAARSRGQGSGGCAGARAAEGTASSLLLLGSVLWARRRLARRRG